MSEEQVLLFWKEKNIYEKSKKKNARGKKFYMMDGPPYASGSIHMGTALNKVLKDIAMRSRRLQGCDVFDRAGYDTHGVPIEFQIEKEIGSKSKSDIEKYGVKKFIEKCKEFATRYIGVMNHEFLNLGTWFDFSNPYLTLSPEYVETIWDTFKEAEKKKLLYLGKYPVHVCPRCATAVAYNEIEYAKQDDTSVYVKFPLKDKKKAFLVIWTTTPWTLPANTGVMVHPDYIYEEVETSEGERWIMAKELLPKIMTTIGYGYTSKKEYAGKEMEGWKYENPLAKNLKLKLKNAYKVVLSSRYVNLEDGTGLVHCAPGHGKEDYEVGKEAGIDMPSPVDISGNMTAEAGKYAGKKARVVDAEIIADLEKDKALLYKLSYSHDYPLCWRCKSPLLMIALPQWFLKVSEIQPKLLKRNEEINWIPDWMKLRMKAWLEGLSDWPVSRMRYWGTPLPIWTCECGERKVIGSRAELEKLSGKKVKEVHMPEIDSITIKCRCGKEMKRVPEVLDVWFDSGVSSWGALNKDEIKKYWPADLNLEGKDQVRGWWNSQLILSEIKWGKKPMDSILEHGMILDIEKRKMSKSLGNATTPAEIIQKYSRDYLRYYFAKISKGEDFSYDESEFKEIEKVFRVLLNVNTFVNQLETKKKSEKSIEDKWIISKFNSCVQESRKSYNEYKFPETVQLLENFMINSLSKAYIQIIRERSDEVYDVLNEIRLGLLKLSAPIIPFTTEKIWQELRERKIVDEESVHLTEWPKADEKKIDRKLEEEMENVMKVIEVGLRERDKVHIGLKWPLAKAIVHCEKKLGKEMQEIVMRQINVKNVEIRNNKENGAITVELDTKMTDELETEGYARELSRAVQSARKNAGLVKSDRINLKIFTRENFVNRMKSQEKFIAERTGSKKIEIIEISDGKNKKKSENIKLKIKDIDFKIYFAKIK